MKLPIKVTVLSDKHVLAQDPFGGRAVGSTRKEAVELLKRELDRHTGLGEVFWIDLFDIDHYLISADKWEDPDMREFYRILGENRVKEQYDEHPSDG